MKKVWIIGWYEEIVKVFDDENKAKEFYEAEMKEDPWGPWLECHDVE